MNDSKLGSVNPSLNSPTADLAFFGTFAILIIDKNPESKDIQAFSGGVGENEAFYKWTKKLLTRVCSMLKQKKLIKETNWDCLIILDACRYDYFEKIYEDYLSGSLRKVISSGSHTTEWIKNTFENGNFNDVVYISANPFITSTGVDWDEINPPKDIRFVENFNPRKIFHKIIDVSPGRSLIFPSQVRKVTGIARAKYPDKRLISHFLSPHNPFLALQENEKSFRKMMITRAGEVLRKLGIRNTTLVKFATDLFKDEKTKNPLEKIAKNYGIEKLHNLYEKNLRLALMEVKNLVDRLPGKIIVSADHGEMLGEKNHYWHTAFSNDPRLREVPWLEITP